MLQIIRDKAHGWVAWVIFGFIAMTFAMLGAHHYFQNSEDTSIAATVDGKTIRVSEVKSLTERIRRQHRARVGENVDIAPVLDKIFKQQALQTLVQAAVLLKSAEKQGFALEEEQIFIALRSIPDFHEDGQFSQQRFNLMLQQANMSGDQFLSRIYQDMMIQQLQGQFVNSSFVMQKDIDMLSELVNQARSIDYLMITAKQFKDKITVSDSEIETYYHENTEQYQIPEQVSVQYLTLDMNTLLDKVQVTEQDIKNYYQAHIDSFTNKPKWKISTIQKSISDDATDKAVDALKAQLTTLRIQLVAGADFATLAKKHSDDIMTSADGGDMGWVTLGTLDASLEQVLVQMSKPGELIGPVRTNYGLLLVKLDDFQKAKVKPLSEVKAQVKVALQQEMTEKVFADASETFANLSFEQPDSLQPVADALQLTIQHSDFFSRDGGESASGIEQYPGVRQAAFSPDVISTGNNSEVIQVTPEKLAVIRLKEQKPASIKPLSSVKDQIENTLKTEKALLKAREVGAQLTLALKTGKSSDSKRLLNQLPEQQWQSKQLTRLAMDFNPSETDSFQPQVYALPRPKGAEPVVAGYEISDGFAVVKLKAVSQTVPSAEKFKEQQDWLRSLLSRRYSLLVSDLYTKALVSDAKVNIEYAMDNLDVE